ncbi:MAG: hypothetical protein M3Q09_06320, partial [Gemmatimonadota bacterium]|nr:hypothetical protein [Gemmatimonadota bacterium]
LGDGESRALSPDGRWAIVQTHGSPHFDVIPTGPGEAFRLQRRGLAMIDARWLPEERNVVVRARAKNGPAHLYVLDVRGSAVRQLTPDSIGVSAWAVSPEGATVAVSNGPHVELFPVAGGDARRVPVASDRWRVVGWIERGLLISENPAYGGTVIRVDTETGRRDTWADINPQDPAGIMHLDLGGLVTTPDGRGYGYSWHRAMSDLYLVEGLV